MKLFKPHTRLNIRSKFLHSGLLPVEIVCQMKSLQLILLDVLNLNWTSIGDK